MAKRNLGTPKTFEEALQELEQILADIEGGELGLEDSLAKYERGNFLIHHCRGVLNTAERQIELLSKGPDGSLQSEPMGQPQDVASDAREA
jgi:exodeoxyribonuclease VII small subunit